VLVYMEDCSEKIGGPNKTVKINVCKDQLRWPKPQKLFEHVCTQLKSSTHSHCPMQNCEGNYRLWHSLIVGNGLAHHLHISAQCMNVSVHA